MAPEKADDEAFADAQQGMQRIPGHFRPERMQNINRVSGPPLPPDAAAAPVLWAGRPGRAYPPGGVPDT